MASRYEFKYTLRCCEFHGRPSEHFPFLEMAIVEFAATTMDEEIYTPYLLANVVLVPFHAVIPPPQLRRTRLECWIHAVPNPNF